MLVLCLPMLSLTGVLRVLGKVFLKMAPNRRRVVGGRHLVCGNCASWIQHENSGCEKKWADTRVEGFVFTCKGCTEVAALAKEVDGLKQMVEDMKEMVAGLRFEDKGAETRSRVTTTGVNQDRELVCHLHTCLTCHCRRELYL